MVCIPTLLENPRYESQPYQRSWREHGCSPEALFAHLITCLLVETCGGRGDESHATAQARASSGTGEKVSLMLGKA